jgi:hypothetical protein
MEGILEVGYGVEFDIQGVKTFKKLSKKLF